MLLVDKVPDIRFDVAKFKMLLKPYLVEAMEKATDELLKSMQIHVHTVTAVGLAKALPVIRNGVTSWIVTWRSCMYALWMILSKVPLGRMPDIAKEPLGSSGQC